MIIIVFNHLCTINKTDICCCIVAEYFLGAVVKCLIDFLFREGENALTIFVFVDLFLSYKYYCLCLIRW